MEAVKQASHLSQGDQYKVKARSANYLTVDRISIGTCPVTGDSMVEVFDTSSPFPVTLRSNKPVFLTDRR